jgi:hypothetical protein
MKDQKNKQQPQQEKQHDNKHDNNQKGQHSSSNQQNTPSSSKTGAQHKSNAQGSDVDTRKGGMNQPGQPDKMTEIDDNPDETKKKIPNMQNKH